MLPPKKKPKGLSVSPPINSITDSPQEFLTNPLPNSSMDSPAEPLVNSSTDQSTDPSTGPSMHLSKDPIMKSPKNLTKISSTNPSANPATTPSEELSKNPFIDPPMQLYKDPFWLSFKNDQSLFASIPKTLSMEPLRMPHTRRDFQQFELGNLDDVGYLDAGSYPLDYEIIPAPINALITAENFVRDLYNERILSANEFDKEIDRIQRIFDEFGQMDPEFSPTIIAKYLKEGHYASTFNRIIVWAILTNLAVNGEIQHTLLPARIVALYRDIDNQSSKANRIMSRKWIQLTFGLVKGGYLQFVASDEWRNNMNRIKHFLIKLLEPYFHKTVTGPPEKSFFSGLNEIFQHFIPMGYHLLGHNRGYRWDWHWIKPTDFEEEPIEETVIINPDMLPFARSPALLLVTDSYGLLLDEPVTCVQSEWDEITKPIPLRLDDEKRARIDRERKPLKPRTERSPESYREYLQHMNPLAQ